MALYLNKLASELSEKLDKEMKESLITWINSNRKKQLGAELKELSRLIEVDEPEIYSLTINNLRENVFTTLNNLTHKELLSKFDEYFNEYTNTGKVNYCYFDNNSSITELDAYKIHKYLVRGKYALMHRIVIY